MRRRRDAAPAEAKAEARTEAEAEADVEVEAEAEAGAEVEAKAEAGAEAAVEAGAGARLPRLPVVVPSSLEAREAQGDADLLDYIEQTLGEVRDYYQRYVGHICRERWQRHHWSKLVNSLDADTAVLTIDYAMNWIERRYRESMLEWFAKRGLVWFAAVIRWKDADGKARHMYIHLLAGNDAGKDSFSTLSYIELTLQLLHKHAPHVKRVVMSSDNAGALAGNGTRLALRDLGSLDLPCIVCHVNPDAQDGKTDLDGDIGVTKGVCVRGVSNGNDAITPAQVVKLINDANLEGHLASVVSIDRSKEQAFEANKNLQNVRKISHVDYHADGSVTVRHQSSLGAGDTITATKWDAMCGNKWGTRRSTGASFMTVVDAEPAVGEHEEARAARAAVVKAKAEKKKEAEELQSRKQAAQRQELEVKRANCGLFYCYHDYCAVSARFNTPAARDRHSSTCLPVDNRTIQARAIDRVIDVLRNTNVNDLTTSAFARDNQGIESHVSETLWGKAGTPQFEVNMRVSVSIYQKGFACKPPPRKDPLPEDMKPYLEDMFLRGVLDKNQKVQPTDALKELAGIKTDAGTIKFKRTELPDVEKVKQYFSTMSTKRKKEIQQQMQAGQVRREIDRLLDAQHV